MYYGTPLEIKDIALIESLGFLVTNPAHHPGKTMEEYCKMAASHDVVIYRTFQDGKIGAGVGKEINAAKAAGKVVLELPPWIEKEMDKRVLTRDETRARVGYGPTDVSSLAKSVAMRRAIIKTALDSQDEFADQD